MNSFETKQKASAPTVTVEEVNRLLEVGRLLFSVLTPEEIEALQEYLYKISTSDQLGNTGDS